MSEPERPRLPKSYRLGSPEENLTALQLRFVEEFLVDMNAAAAARRAGFRGTPDKVGSRLLSKPHIRAAVRRRMDERSARLKLSQDYVIERLMREAECDVAEGNATARVRALELLGKHLGMFWDRHEVVNRSEVVYVEVAPQTALPEPDALPAEVEEPAEDDECQT